jgi:hypothetical protein
MGSAGSVHRLAYFNGWDSSPMTILLRIQPIHGSAGLSKGIVYNMENRAH